MSEQELWQLTTNDRIAIGKAASFLRFQAAYSVDATESARQEWRSTAEALIDIERRCHPQPAEDPDEWVILDPVKYAGHVLRKNIDFTNTRTGWEPISIWGGDTIGGVMNDYKGEQVLFRCRRRDLPKAEQPAAQPACDECGGEVDSGGSTPWMAQPQKTRVRLWVSQSAVIVRDANETGFGKEIHYDAETKQFYVEGGQP